MNTTVTPPSRDARRTALPPPRRLATGLEAWLDGWRGRWRSRDAVREGWLAQGRAAHRELLDCRGMADTDLTKALAEARVLARRRREPDGEARSRGLGLVAEAARRCTDLTAHPEQLAGAIGLGEGALVEMATGEGKTLTLALTALLRGWRGRPVHVVTANDYLARRDARAFREFYGRGGLSVGWVIGGMDAEERRTAYACDVVYTTARELLADVLRDRLALGPWLGGGRRAVRRLGGVDPAGSAGVVMRGIHTVLVDEADHVLIDEAATPLIISSPRRNADLRAACVEAAEFSRLIATVDYRVDVAAQEVDLKPTLRRRLREQWEPKAAVLANPRWREELIRQALRAREFFKRDQHYLVKDGKVVIIDEGTGRPQEQRSWRQGLHQMIEALEGVELTDPADTLASISFQRFFRQVPDLAGVSGTAREEAAEFWRVYGLPVVALPSHRPVQRTVSVCRVFASAEARWRTVTELVKKHSQDNRAVLVGTRSVAASEHLAERLAHAGLPCAVLNARHLDREAQLVAEAGRAGCITIATNLAGRGTDIQLRAGVVEAGGLVVIATERHAAARIDRQLQGRAGRQGDPGRVECLASLEDDLVRKRVPRWWRWLVERALGGRLPGAHLVARWTLDRAQSTAERRLSRQRANLARQDQRLALYLGES